MSLFMRIFETHEGPKALELGSGARFEKLKKTLTKKGASTPGALAAWIGRKKFGGKFNKLSAAEKKNSCTEDAKVAKLFALVESLVSLRTAIVTE